MNIESVLSNEVTRGNSTETTVDAGCLALWRKDVTDDSGKAIIFWQDPTFIGFITIGKEGVLDIAQGGPSNLNYPLLEDLRLFGPRGEWHAWRAPKGKWRARFRPARQGTAGDIDERHFLWGELQPKDSANPRKSGWSATEDVGRGICVWLPWSQKEGISATLRVRQIVGRDPETGLAGIVDAMLLWDPAWKVV